jgi:hypothetical protein
MKGALNAVLLQVLHGVNWPIIFYLLFALMVLWVLRQLGLSPAHLAIEIVQEVIGVLTRPGSTRVNIDGAITIASIVFVGFTIMALEIHELSEVMSIFRAGVEAHWQPLYLIVLLIFAGTLAGILSLWATR